MAFRATGEQKAVIEAALQARILVEAGAGTGKTEIVARRIAHLLSGGARPAEILVLSFSRAAVRVLTERLRQVAREASVVEELRWTTVRTFDSWTFRLRRLLGADPASLLEVSFDDNVRGILGELAQGDRVLEVTGLNRIRHVIVDEMQDVTGLRARLVKRVLELLVPPSCTDAGFTLLGDPCQAIYDWTLREQGGEGFRSRDLLDWVRSAYRGTLRPLAVTGNQRASRELAPFLEDARKCLQETSAGQDGSKALEAIRRTRDGLSVGDVAVAAGEMGSLTKGSLAVLCRDNGQVLSVAEALIGAIPEGNSRPVLTVLAGSPPRRLPSWIALLLSEYEGTQLSRRHFEKLFAHLDAARAPCNAIAAEAWRMLLRLARLGDNDAALSMDALRQRISWPDSLPDDEGEAAQEVLVTTIHQSKGREFDRVRILDSSPESPENPAEEARVVYVGLTRARKDVSLLEADVEGLFHSECREGRARWHRWNAVRGRGAQHHLELGCIGDLVPASVVCSNIAGGEAAVRQVQDLLATQEDRLVGIPIKAKKTVVSQRPLRVAYRLYADLPSVGESCLGQFSNGVSLDILGLKHKDQGLPTNIYGLRIGAIGTVVSTGELPADVPAPWRDSRIWLGVTVHGLASFVTFWSNRGRGARA
jgi:hypothetical protein